MKPVSIKDARVHAVVTRDNVYLTITDKTGRTVTFEPPASPVTQAWAEEMLSRAHAQMELPL